MRKGEINQVNMKCPFWLKAVLYIAFIMYAVNLIPYLSSWNSLIYHLGIYGVVFFVCYCFILISIVLILKELRLGYYLFLIFSAAVVILFLLSGKNFSFEQAVLRPVVFCSLVISGVNSKL